MDPTPPSRLTVASHEVLAALKSGPLTTRQLAQATGRHLMTIRRATAALRASGRITYTVTPNRLGWKGGRPAFTWSLPL